MLSVTDAVPMPKPIAGRQRVYPFDKLEPGSSFFVPGANKSNHVSPSIRWWKRAHPEQVFTVRKVTEDGVTGVRVWRTA